MMGNNKAEVNAIGHCIGYGNLNFKYAFFGLEEKEVQKTNNTKRNLAYIKKFEELNEYYVLSNEEIYAECPECQDDDEKVPARIFDAYKFIYEKLSDDIIGIGEFGTESKSILIGNLFPFAKPESNSDYQAKEAEWLEKNEAKKYVFCFGNLEQYLKKFCEYGEVCFGKERQFEATTHNSNIYYKLPNHNLYLLRHPSYGWLSNDQICEVLAELKPELENNGI